VLTDSKRTHVKTFRFLVVLAVVGVLVSSASTAATKQYVVAAIISHGGHVIAAPEFLMLEGTTGTARQPGPDGCILNVTVKGSDPGFLKVATNLHSAYGAINPTILIRSGQSALVSIGGLELKLAVIELRPSLNPYIYVN
jgi:hypothetical protein